MKKLLSILLLVAVITASVCVPAGAVELNKGLLEYVYEQIMSNKDANSFSVDVNKYDIPYKEDDWSFSFELFGQLKDTYPELYWLELSRVSVGILGSEISEYNFTRKLNDSQIYVVEDFLKRAVSAVNPAWSDFEKALWIHDHMAETFMYDRSIFYGGDGNHHLYEIINETFGVCSAYAELYDLLLSRVGVESKLAYHDDPAGGAGHEWNLVKIDNEWYHVDVTHDDPLHVVRRDDGYDYMAIDLFGRVGHDHFMLNDAQLEALENLPQNTGKCTEHSNWYVHGEKPAVNSTKYEKMHLRDSESSVVEAQGKWYFIDHGSFVGGSEWTVELRSTTDFINCELVTKLNAFWPLNDGTGRGYVGPYGGLESIHGYVYYNTVNSIVRYDPITNTHTPLSGDLLVTEVYDADGHIYLDKNNMPNGPKHTISEFASGNDVIYGFIIIDLEGKFVVQTGKTAEDYTYNLAEGQLCTLTGGVVNHTDGAWITTKEPTETDEGEKELHCKYCNGVLQIQAIPVLVTYILGDLNGDNYVNTSDLSDMKLFLANALGDRKINEIAADFNDDKAVNTVDLSNIKLKLAGA